MQTLDDYVWVFVGCGGTFYAVSPYLAVLARRYCKGVPILIDPDVVDLGNLDRQWPGSKPGESKVVAAERALQAGAGRLIVERFRGDDKALRTWTNGLPVLAIVNVDNDQARLDVAEWLESRMSPGIMIVSGCERTHGQCYPGIWVDGKAVFDWRVHHPDVGSVMPGKGGPSANHCQPQDVRANALTGVLVGICVEGMIRCTKYDIWDRAREYYWDTDGGVRVYSVVANCEERGVL